MVGKLSMAMALLAASTVAAYAVGDPAKGKQVFQRCANCHTVQRGGGDALGPDLYGVVGRKAASRPGFAYSPALKKSGITWTPDTLAKWVAGPARVVPGTKMAFGGISSKGQQADVVAYLGTLK